MILNITKPKGLTSFQVVSKIKKKFNIKKVGHAGTLDPLASGVLILLTDKDTKNQDEIMKQSKEYIVDITFGISTPSHDLEFLPTVTNAVSLAELSSTIEQKLSKYKGEIIQEIPVFSAKKVAGKPLYKTARKNLNTDAVAGNMQADVVDSNHFKQVLIHEIFIMDMYDSAVATNLGIKKLPTIKLKVASSHGFFVRSLARDLGRNYNTTAVVTELIRSRVGEFSLEKAVIPDLLQI